MKKANRVNIYLPDDVLLAIEKWEQGYKLAHPTFSLEVVIPMSRICQGAILTWIREHNPTEEQ